MLSLDFMIFPQLLYLLNFILLYKVLLLLDLLFAESGVSVLVLMLQQVKKTHEFLFNLIETQLNDVRSGLLLLMLERRSFTCGLSHGCVAIVLVLN